MDLSSLYCGGSLYSAGLRGRRYLVEDNVPVSTPLVLSASAVAEGLPTRGSVDGNVGPPHKYVHVCNVIHTCNVCMSMHVHVTCDMCMQGVYMHV